MIIRHHGLRCPYVVGLDPDTSTNSNADYRELCRKPLAKDGRERLLRFFKDLGI